MISKKLRSMKVRLVKLDYYFRYVKVAKFIIWKRIFDQNPDTYGFIWDDVLQKIKKSYIFEKIVDDKKWLKENGYEDCLNYVLNNGLDVYMGALKGVNLYTEEDVAYDEKIGLYFGMYEGKKMYFSKSIDSKEKALNYLNSTSAEQISDSPHKYISDTFSLDKDDIVFDVGCSAANFTLSVIDQIKEAYLFESDANWIEPLTHTFEPYKEKIHIIKKLVSDRNSDTEVSIDEFIKCNSIESVGLIKMDVEGYEKSVLKGAQKSIDSGKIKKISFCAYHNADDEEKICRMLPNYSFEYNNGYMLGALIYKVQNIKRPYFVRGVIKATLKESN